MTDYRGAASEGNRAANLMKKRANQKEELELMKQKIAEVSHAGPETSTMNARIFVSLMGRLRLQEHGTAKFEVTNKFATSYDVVEEQLKSSTVGMAMTCYCASLVPLTLLLRNRVW